MFPLMFLAAVTLPNWAVIAGVGGLAAAGGFVLFGIDHKREQFKRELIQLSQVAASEGLPLTEGIMEDVVVDDLSGLTVHVRNLIGRLRNPDSRREVVLPFLRAQLSKWAKGEGGRDPAHLVAFVEETLGVKLTVTPKAPPVPPAP